MQDAVVNVRAVLTGPKEDALPAILDGERRLGGLYVDALGAAPPGDMDRPTLQA